MSSEVSTNVSPDAKKPGIFSKERWTKDVNLTPEERDKVAAQRKALNAQIAEGGGKKEGMFGFRASIKGLFKKDEAAAPATNSTEPDLLPEPVGPPPPSNVAPTVDPKLENESCLTEKRSSICSQKDGGKWKVDMRYVGNYTEDINIMRKEKAGEQAKVEYADPQRLRVSAADLKANKNPNVDPSMKEQYLAEKEFQQHFGMPKADFNKMPNWKRLNLKKEKGFN